MTKKSDEKNDEEKLVKLHKFIRVLKGTNGRLRDGKARKILKIKTGKRKEKK